MDILCAGQLKTSTSLSFGILSFTHCFFINKQKPKPRKTSNKRDKPNTPVSGIHTVFWSSSPWRKYSKSCRCSSFVICLRVDEWLGVGGSMWILCHHRCHLLLHKSYIDVHCKHLTIISKLHPDKELEVHCLTLCLACCCCPQEVKDDTDLATCRTNTMTVIDCLGLKNKTYFSLAKEHSSVSQF